MVLILSTAPTVEGPHLGLLLAMNKAVERVAPAANLSVKKSAFSVKSFECVNKRRIPLREVDELLAERVGPIVGLKHEHR